MGYKKQTQAGNVFFALFGAVAFVGVLGAATMGFMKGPLKTSVTLSRMSVADTQMQVASQMAVLQASSETDSGDCDADGFVEPMEYLLNATAGQFPTGGGNIPNTLGATKRDPWGRLYGYCVWNSGSNTAIGGTAACDDDSDGDERRLAGSPWNYDVVLAIISAGPDRTFATTCRDFATADDNSNGVLGDAGDLELVSKTSGSDDVILAYTYAEAATVGGGGLWSIKSSDPGTATIDKAIEFTGGLSMGTSSSVTTCDASSANVMRFNPFNDSIEVCDGAGVWNSLAAGVTGNDTEVQFNNAGSPGADAGLTYDLTNDILNVGSGLTVGETLTLGATTGAAAPSLISIPTAGFWTDNSSHISYNNFHILNPGDTMITAGFDPTTDDSYTIYHSDKSAMRGGTGGSGSGSWNEANIGDNSFAWGRGTIAVGDHSTVFGNYTGAISSNSGSSFVAGDNSFSYGQAGIALGRLASAMGNHSVAIGRNVTAGVDYVAGSNQGDHSMAIGLGNASGVRPRTTADHTLGIFLGDQSGVTLGTANRMGLYGGDFLIDDDGTAGSQGCIRYLEGTGLQFSNDCTSFSPFAGGGGLWTDNSTHTSLQGIHVFDPGENMGSAGFDFGNPITGFVVHTDLNAIVGGNHPSGVDDGFVGNASFAWGQGTAGGDYAMMLGRNSSANGDDAIALGVALISSGLGSVAIGNASAASNNESYTFGSGVDTSGTQSIAFGVAETGGTRPVVSATNSIGFFSGDQDGADLSDFNTIGTLGFTGGFGIETLSPGYTFDVNGDINYSGSLTNISDIRLKEDIKEIDDALEKISNLQGISYHLIDDEDKKKRLGFSAQELQKIYPELVSTDDNGTLAVNYIGLIAPLVESVKTLKDQNDDLQAQIEEIGAPAQADHKWLYLLLGLFGGVILSNALKHLCCSKKAG